MTTDFIDEVWKMNISSLYKKSIKPRGIFRNTLSSMQLFACGGNLLAEETQKLTQTFGIRCWTIKNILECCIHKKNCVRKILETIHVAKCNEKNILYNILNTAFFSVYIRAVVIKREKNGNMQLKKVLYYVCLSC